MSNPEGKPHEFQLFQLFQVSKAMLRSEDGRLLGWDVLLPDLLRHGTKPPSWSSWIVLEAKGCSEQSTHFSCFWVRQSRISGTRNIAKTCNKKSCLYIYIYIFTRILYSKKPWHSRINALCGSVLPVGSDFNSFMSHNSTIEQYLKHSFHLTSIPWTSMDCWLVKVGPSCGLVDDETSMSIPNRQPNTLAAQACQPIYMVFRLFHLARSTWKTSTWTWL